MARTKKFLFKENKILRSNTFDKKHYEDFEKTIKYFPKDKWDLFIELAAEKEDRNRRRNVLIFRLLLSLGARVEEFSLIKRAEIDFREGLVVIHDENSKSKHSRRSRVKKSLLNDLRDYLESNNIKSGYLFRNKKNEPLAPRTYRAIFDKYFLTSKIKEKLDLDFKPHPHTLRHNHIIYSLQQGVSINAVMQQVGHIDLKTTQIYSRLAGVEISKGYERVDF